MKKTIWYMHKPGDVRDFAMTTSPSPEWAAIMAKEGFKLFECLVEIPMDEVQLEGYGAQTDPTVEVPLVPHKCRGCGSDDPGTHMMLCDYAGTG